jgi:hypothetical protein
VGDRGNKGAQEAMQGRVMAMLAARGASSRESWGRLGPATVVEQTWALGDARKDAKARGTGGAGRV